jgi:hypothetical protein
MQSLKVLVWIIFVILIMFWGQILIKILKYLLYENLKSYLYIKFASNDNRKLRTYRKFEFLCDAENHLIRNIPGKFRTAISKFRCGVALVRIEAGKYENVWVVNTVYFNYKVIEDEHHVLLQCSNIFRFP